MAYLMEAPDRPLLAVVGGFNLEPRVKLIDGLLDIVDILAIGGGLSTTFLASMRAGAADGLGGDGGQKRLRKWGMGTAGLPRDSRDVLIVARRLLIKARKRGVEVRKRHRRRTGTGTKTEVQRPEESTGISTTGGEYGLATTFLGQRSSLFFSTCAS